MSVELQQRFTARVRAPHQQPLPAALPPQRVAVYERLIRNNIEGFVRGTFPVLHKVLPAARWDQLIDAFVAGHTCQSPYFRDIGEQFIDWLQDGYQADANDPPWLLELAHYEWVELALDISNEQLPAGGQGAADADTLLNWSSLAWPLLYQWPVQQLGLDYQPVEPPAQPTCLLVWRDGEDRVRFMQLTPFAWQLADVLSREPLSLRTALARLHVTADAQFMSGALSLVSDWVAADVLRATQPTS
ncbi:HvfC family RiPP maturation protein [Halopseudomonas maritima]|uniref:HvfC family RiPP maturation protein n=1 Tax=Halopseudomonas maritima TaxID=2918528 RepID=UPI001EEB7F71|nr:putative DNA-binding domain-containing protein [Halopseudomonas maritima]UJJ31884.1 putative DNA-binding domain-containing protein [Halopseudomonas maritima]